MPHPRSDRETGTAFRGAKRIHLQILPQPARLVHPLSHSESQRNGQLYFRVEKSPEGTEMLRKILRDARAAFARTHVELLPIAPGALHEYEL